MVAPIVHLGPRPPALVALTGPVELYLSDPVTVTRPEPAVLDVTRPAPAVLDVRWPVARYTSPPVRPARNVAATARPAVRPSPRAARRIKLTWITPDGRLITPDGRLLASAR